LAVQAYIGRRREDFQTQFIGALRMVQNGVIAADEMRSSWAGAMGLVQFLPSDYWSYAVDEDGDGRKDIWKSVPDALASLANNLKTIGWDSGQPWGIEVNVPSSIDCTLANLDIRKKGAEWTAMGITPLKGTAFSPGILSSEASLLLPAGMFGPGFLTFNNFQIIREYNKSDLYALFVGHLADRIGGSGSFSRKWDQVIQVPAADVEELQRQLTAKGLYQDKVDGKAGARTRSAVGLYQKQAGLRQTCWPTPEVITHMKKNASLR
jgi:lytic murein transglycosylase